MLALWGELFLVALGSKAHSAQSTVLLWKGVIFGKNSVTIYIIYILYNIVNCNLLLSCNFDMALIINCALCSVRMLSVFSRLKPNCTLNADKCTDGVCNCLTMCIIQFLDAK